MTSSPYNTKKPNFISHYLVLKDLISGVDVRQFSDHIVYLTSRIENIKNELCNRGLLFDEYAIAYTKLSHYKPYVLIQTEANIKLAKELLEQYKTEKVSNFLSRKDEVQES